MATSKQSGAGKRDVVKIIAAHIKATRILYKQSQTIVAARARMSRPYLAKIESGSVDFSVGNLVAIAQAIGPGSLDDIIQVATSRQRPAVMHSPVKELPGISMIEQIAPVVEAIHTAHLEIEAMKDKYIGISQERMGAPVYTAPIANENELF